MASLSYAAQRELTLSTPEAEGGSRPQRPEMKNKNAMQSYPYIAQSSRFVRHKRYDYVTREGRESKAKRKDALAKCGGMPYNTCAVRSMTAV